MMIAARLAGGNLFFAFFVVGGLLGAARSTRIFLRGILWWGILGALGAARSARIFFEGICGGGFFFLGGGGVCFGL